MPKLTTQDGASLFYKAWGIGSPVVFSHGWPLNGDAWDPQLLAMASTSERSRTIGAGTAARASHGRATRWTTTPTTSPR